MNSIGSVIPVTNEVIAAPKNKPPTKFLFSFGTQWYIAKQAAGSPNIIVAKRPAKNLVPSVNNPTWLGSANWAKNIFCAPTTVCPATWATPPNSEYQNNGYIIWCNPTAPVNLNKNP